VVYLIAVLAGLVSTTPLAVVGIVTVTVTTPPLVFWWADMVAHWKDLRMTHDWSLTPPRTEGEARIRRVYNRAPPFEFAWIAGVALIVVVLALR